MQRRPPHPVLGEGRYVLVRPTGRDALGEVWAARDEALRRPVTIRVLPDGLTPRQRARLGRRVDELLRPVVAGERVVRWCRLDHPSLVRVLGYDDGGEDGPCFVVMEPVEGESLSDRLRRDGRIGREEAAAIVATVRRGLEAAHRAGVVHGGLSADAIVLTPDGGVRVRDFGIRAALEETEGSGEARGVEPAGAAPDADLAALEALRPLMLEGLGAEPRLPSGGGPGVVRSGPRPHGPLGQARRFGRIPPPRVEGRRRARATVVAGMAALAVLLALLLTGRRGGTPGAGVSGRPGVERRGLPALAGSAEGTGGPSGGVTLTGSAEVLGPTRTPAATRYIEDVITRGMPSSSTAPGGSPSPAGSPPGPPAPFPSPSPSASPSSPQPSPSPSESPGPEPTEPSPSPSPTESPTPEPTQSPCPTPLPEPLGCLPTLAP